MILTSCQREIVPEGPTKINVRIADNDAETRTSYDNLEGKFTWNAGDEIAIHYKGGKYETYAVSPNSDPVTGSVLSSSVGTKLRNDFAVYPATAAVATADGAAPKVNFPAEYDLTALTGVTEEYAPALLLAANMPDEDLAFYHAGGLARFVLTDVNRSVTKIVVTFDKEVTGEFVAVTDDADEPIPYVETRDGEGTSVTFLVNRNVIGSDKAIDLNLPVPCGTYEWAKVEFFVGDTQDGSTLMHSTPMEFSRHHGKRIAFVDAGWELFIGNKDGSSIGRISVPSGTPTLTNDGGLLTLASSFVSYKTDGTNIEPVPFHLQYSTNGSTWTDEIPDWVSFTGTVDVNGSVPDFPQEVSIAVDPLQNLIPMNDFGVPIPEGSHSWNLHNTPSAGTVDLSTINVATGATVPTSTANSYVVQAPGTYTFPFVYGNGLKKGAVNEEAFRGMQKNADTGAYEFRPDEGSKYNNRAKAGILGRFLDHKGDHIMSPYIAEQLGDDTYTAQVIWMDQPGLIESVSYEAGGAGPADDRIQFVVSPEGIVQGNALIGVLDGTGTIVWSWHIWITDEVMTQTKRIKALNSTNEGFQMAPVNIGWCNMVQIAEYQRIRAYLRIIQDEAGGKATNSVTITVGTNSTDTRYGHAPYFNPGRKDPILAYDGNRSFMGPKAVYPIREVNPFYPQYAILDQTTVGGTIQHPYIHYYPDSGYGHYLEVTYGNLWNSTQTVFNSSTSSPASFYTDPVTKTIYDPSPVGYKVPGAAVFADFTFDEIDTYGYDTAQAIDGCRVIVVDQTPLPAMGFPEKYLRNINSALTHYACAEGRYTGSYSGMFHGTYFHWYQSYRACYVNSVTNAQQVRATVDIWE